ncbi:MAG: hypothetical protein HYS08_05485 [Chlamydiae bacterium]|nr:hypothetical protein [Chlamydiota bacterium]MBI3267169.1 hypothetical protein [Chlamydiota bacterium]
MKTDILNLVELQKLDREISSVLKNAFEVEKKSKEKTLLRKLNGMRKTRLDLVQTLDTLIAKRYEKLRGHKGESTAVVPVIKGICQGCFIGVSTATYAEIQRKDVAATCDHCGRFIYYSEFSAS